MPGVNSVKITTIKKHRNERLAYRNQNREKQIENSKRYNENHKEELRQYRIEYYNNNKSDILDNIKQKYEQNSQYKLNCITAKNMWKVLKGAKSEQHWKDIVGYSTQQLIQHLESQFTPEMNWNNYGSYWEIDHIIPKSQFTYSSHEDQQFKICWSLMNLRPLEKATNRQRPKDGSDIPCSIIQTILNQFEH